MVVKSATDRIPRARAHGRSARPGRPVSRLSIQDQLVEHILALRMLVCVIVASADALQDRCSGSHAEIGMMLRRCCCDPLRTEIHNMDVLLGRLTRRKIR